MLPCVIAGRLESVAPIAREAMNSPKRWKLCAAAPSSRCSVVGMKLTARRRVRLDNRGVHFGPRTEPHAGNGHHLSRSEKS